MHQVVKYRRSQPLTPLTFITCGMKSEKKEPDTVSHLISRHIIKENLLCKSKCQAHEDHEVALSLLMRDLCCVTKLTLNVYCKPVLLRCCTSKLPHCLVIHSKTSRGRVLSAHQVTFFVVVVAV